MKRRTRVSKSTLPSAQLSPADTRRLHAQIVPTSTCHLWMGAVGSDGYGRFWVPAPTTTPDTEAVPDRVSPPARAGRVITPHAAVSALVFGALPLGSTHLHDCDVRLCVNTHPGHLRRGTQQENIRQAVARGHQRGRKPGMVDVRGPAGASHAIQDAIRAALVAGDASPQLLAGVLAQVLADGFPMVDVLPLFAEPEHKQPPYFDCWNQPDPLPRRASIDSIVEVPDQRFEAALDDTGFPRRAINSYPRGLCVLKAQRRITTLNVFGSPFAGVRSRVRLGDRLSG